MFSKNKKKKNSTKYCNFTQFFHILIQNECYSFVSFLLEISAFKKLFICLFQNSENLGSQKKKKILVIMETGTHPGFPQILSPLSQCHDEPSRNSSSRLERGSFMRVEPEERVSFATHRGLLCLNEQQRVRVASSTNTFFHSFRSIERNRRDWIGKFASLLRHRFD